MPFQVHLPNSVLGFFKIVLNGKQSDARSGMNLLNCFTAPRNDLNSFKLGRRLFSVFPCTFVCTGDFPLFVILKPNHSISFTAILHFSAFNCNSPSSSVLRIYRTLSKCSLFIPFVTFKISSINANTSLNFADNMSITF